MMSVKLLVNDTLNLIRGKSIRYMLEDNDLRVIANLVRVVDENNLTYDQETMVYQDLNAKAKRAQLAKELEPGLNALFGAEYAKYDTEAARLERNRKAREKYHAKKAKAKRGRPRKAA
jgi:hypothetical protein